MPKDSIEKPELSPDHKRQSPNNPPPSKSHHEFLKKAKSQYDAAFHLLHVTYPLIKDPHFLIGIATNLLNSYEAGMQALLSYDQEHFHIGPYTNTFSSKFTHFRAKSVPRHHIPSEHIQIINTLREIIDLHKKSPTEFQRGNRFVICNDQFSFKTISASDLKEHLTHAQFFLEQINSIINRKA